MVDEEQVEIGLKEPYTYKSFHSELQKIVKVKVKLQRIEAEINERQNQGILSGYLCHYLQNAVE